MSELNRINPLLAKIIVIALLTLLLLLPCAERGCDHDGGPGDADLGRRRQGIFADQ